MTTESSYSKSDVLLTAEASPKTVELEAVEVLPYAEEEGEDSSFSKKRKPKKKQIKNIKAESFSTKLESAVEPEAVDAEPIVEGEKDSGFSTKRKPKKTQDHDVAGHEYSMTIEQQVELKPSIKEEIDIEPEVTVETEWITIESGVVAKPRKTSIKTITEEAQSSDSVTNKQSPDETKTVETELITIESGISAKPRMKSIKKTSAVEPETVDAEPIVQDEDDSGLSTKRKPKKTQVQDVAGHSMTTEQPVERKLPIKEEIDIEPEVIVETEQITIKSGVVAKPRKKSIRKIAEEAPSGISIPSDETRTVETEAITIESGFVAKPRKMSIKKNVEQSESISIEEETTIVTPKKSKKESSKSDQSQESPVVTVLKRIPSSKLL